MDFTKPIVDFSKKYVEPAFQLAAGLPSEIAGGLAGLVTANPDNVAKIAEMLKKPFQAQSAPAKETLQKLADILSGTKKTMVDDNPPIRMAVDGYNSLTDYARDRSPLLGAAMKTLPTAAMTLLGPGSAMARDAFASAGRGALSAGEQAMRNAAAVPVVRGPLAAQRGSIGVEKPFVYPQDQALETARKNAVDMLGLPENNTSMDRANALGYTTEAYHGRAGDFSEFSDQMKGDRNPHPFVQIGHFASNSPNAVNTYIGKNKNTNIIPMLLKMENPEIFNSGDVGGIAKQKFVPTDDSINNAVEAIKREGVKNIPSEDSEIKSNYQAVREGLPFFMDKMQKNNTNSLILKDSLDMPESVMRGKRIGATDQYVMFNPSDMRSKFAAFDPARVNENDLLGAATPEFLKYLAGGSAAGLGAPLVYDQYKKYTDKK